MAGEGLASFIVGLLKGKGEAEKQKQKKKKAQAQAEKQTRTDNIAYWKNQAARFDTDSPAKDYALSMVAFYSDTTGTMIEPIASAEVQAAVYGSPQTTTTSTSSEDEAVIPVDYDQTSKKNIKARHIQATLKRWYNSQSEEFKSKNPNWVPSFSNVLADMARFEQITADIQSNRDAAVREMTTEKTDMDIAEQNKKVYIDDLEDNIGLLFDELSLYDFSERNKNKSNYSQVYQEYLTSLMNMKKVSGGKVPTKPIDEAGMNRLIEYLQLYERLTGSKYKFTDEVWNMKVGDPESATESGMVVTGGEAEQVLGTTTTLADMYARSTFTDISTQEDFRAQPLEYFAKNKNYKEAFDLVEIYDEEKKDYDAVRLKIENIQKKLNTYQQTIYMRDWSASHDFAPIIDDRKQIRDMREKLANPNLGKMKENPTFGKEIENPDFNQEEATAAFNNNLPYNIPEFIIDDRKEIEDTDTHINNPNYFPNSNTLIDNPNLGHPLPFGDINPSGKYFGDPANLPKSAPSLAFPYAQKEEEEE